MDVDRSPTGTAHLHSEPPKSVQDPWSKEPQPHVPYAAFTSTIRLYAGWVLAWSIATLALLAYEQTRKLPFSLSYLDALGNVSSLILISSAAFLFIVFSSLHRLFKGKFLLGIVLAIVWGLSVFFIQQNL